MAFFPMCDGCRVVVINLCNIELVRTQLKQIAGRR